MGSVGTEEMDQLHVLAVDDSLVDRKVIERLLKVSCCKVTAVESGTRALEFLGLDEEKGSVEYQELKVNLIMTDYSMPGMTGYELLKKIKGSQACKEIPVVIMSSENIMTRIDRCLEEGAKDFLMKPVKLSDVERLRDYIMKGEDKVSEKQLSPSQLPLVSVFSPSQLPLVSVPSPLEQTSLPPATTPVILTPQATPSLPSSISLPATPPSNPAMPLTQSLPPLFASDLSCSLQHLSSPPSSPHWPSKRPRLLNGDQ